MAIFVRTLAWTIFIFSSQKLVKGSDKKGCQLNDALIHEKIFPNFACWKCYESLKPVGRLTKVNCKIQIDGEAYTTPGFVVEDVCVPFDHRTKSISKLVQSSLPTATFELFYNCCSNAAKCCETMIENYQVENFFDTCENHWDGNCYQDTSPRKAVKKLCPYEMTRKDKSKCHHFSAKQCTVNGIWAATDYSQCLPDERLQTNIMWHIIIMSVSLVVCVPPMFIFLIKKEVRSKIISMIVVLISIIWSRNFLFVITKSIIFVEPLVLERNLWTCKLTTILMELADNFVFVYLLVVGMSLSYIALDFAMISKKIFLLLGLLVSILTTLAWTLTMQFTSDKYCWQLDTEFFHHWINDGPRLFMLLLTSFYFYKTLFYGSSKIHQEDILTTKLLIIVWPFFFLPFIIMLVDTMHNTCGWEELSKLLITSSYALQLIMLNFVFFLNPKIQKLFENFYPCFWKKISSQESNVSLAPSKTSRGSDGLEPIHSWNDFVIRARNSVCNENLYTTEPRLSISTLPDPPTSKIRTSLVISPSNNAKVNSDQTRRHTIRDIMWRAKNNFQGNESVPENQPIAKCVTPPLPKNIPNQILDDVQLFDFYYNNLSSIFIDEDSPTPHTSTINDDEEKASTMKRISKMMSTGSLKSFRD